MNLLVPYNYETFAACCDFALTIAGKSGMNSKPIECFDRHTTEQWRCGCPS